MKAFDDGLAMNSYSPGVGGTTMDVKRSGILIVKFELRVPLKGINLGIS